MNPLHEGATLAFKMFCDEAKEFLVPRTRRRTKRHSISTLESRLNRPETVSP
jgi:hypothetical protein